MKCPNCSFENSDDTKNCKVCGFELITKVNAPKKRVIDDSEEEALDTALKSLFGHDTNKAADEEDPLDVASVERMLKKKRPILTQTPDNMPELPEEDLSDDTPLVSQEPNEGTTKHTFSIILIVSIILVILLVFFNSSLARKLWKYKGDDSTTEASSVETTETIPTETTTETVFSLGDDATLEPVNAFFNALPSFVNQGNLGILSLFTNSQEALDVLTTFAIVGNVERISGAAVNASEVAEDSATYTIQSSIDRLIEGEQKQVPVVWDFRLVLVDGSWKIESFSLDDTGAVTPGATEATTEKSTEATTEKSNEATTEKSTEATTEPTTEAKLEGFVASGGFTGGTAATGQDIASARYGNHDSYERLVFDLYEWIGGQPTTPVEVMSNYNTSISEDGKTIRITIAGVLDAYADNLNLDLKNSPNIKSVQYAVSGTDESVTITILLNNACTYKVFGLKSPAKLVVDIARVTP